MSYLFPHLPLLIFLLEYLLLLDISPRLSESELELYTPILGLIELDRDDHETSLLRRCDDLGDFLRFEQ